MVHPLLTRLRDPVPGLAALLLGLALVCQHATADTPASAVLTTAVAAGQSYPVVMANSEAWFDVGGFCKVVDVGGLAWTNPPADGVPVFIPGPAAQWENYRTAAAPAYHADLLLTTCCRPQSAIATLCASATNPTPVSRQYGRLGETDVVAVTCQGSDGPYVESATFACSGDNGPDGQAAWSQSGPSSDVCAPNAQTVYGPCSAPGNCGSGSQNVTVLDSCGNVTSVTSQSCTTGVACCTTDYVKTGCSGSTATYTDEGTCNSGSYTVANGCQALPSFITFSACTLQHYSCNTIPYYDCGPRTCSTGNIATTWVNYPSPPNTYCTGPEYCGAPTPEGCTLYECAAVTYE